MLVNSEGIVLKQKKIANNRRMITLFTKNYGKISAGTSMTEKGKGKSALALRPFTYADYDIFKTRETYNINSAQVKKSYYSIGEDLDRFAVASKLLEYLDKILEDEQARPKLFDMTIEFFESITRANANYETLLYAFIFKTLRMQGVMPEIKGCVYCGKPSNVFSIPAGGIICEDCIKKENESLHKLIYRPTFDIIETVKYFVTSPLKQFEKISLKPEVSNQIRDILTEYVDYYLGIDVLKKNDEWR